MKTGNLMQEYTGEGVVEVQAPVVGKPMVDGVVLEKTAPSKTLEKQKKDNISILTESRI